MYRIILILLLLLVGCASYKPQTVNVSPIHTYKNKVDYSGLHIAVDPFDTAEKAKSAFYADVTSKNIKPLHIIIENKSSNTYIIDRQSLILTSNIGNDLQPVNSNYVFSRFEHNELLHAFFGFGIFSYMKAEDANEKMKADWYSKELPEEITLTKRRRTSGFVFFETTDHLKGKTLIVPLIDLKNDEDNVLEIRIN